MGNTFVYTLGGAVYINLTNSCCNDCEFCLRRNGDSVENNSSLWLDREPESHEVIAALEGLGFDYKEAVFCGYGESTYRMSVLTEVARYLKSTGKKVRLNTNGLGNKINAHNIESGLKGLVDVVSVSLNAADPVGYDRVCRSVYGLDAFPSMLEFVKNCVRLGIETVLTVVDVIDKNEIIQCEKIAASLGAKLRVRKNISDNAAYV